MALELGIDAQRAHQDIDSISKKLLGLGDDAARAGARVSRAFSQKAFKEVTAALRAMRNEYQRAIDQQAKVVQEARNAASATQTIANALKKEEAATHAVNTATRTRISVAKQTSKSLIELAQKERQLAEARQDEARRTAEVVKQQEREMWAAYDKSRRNMEALLAVQSRLNASRAAKRASNFGELAASEHQLKVLREHAARLETLAHIENRVRASRAASASSGFGGLIAAEKGLSVIRRDSMVGLANIRRVEQNLASVRAASATSGMKELVRRERQLAEARNRTEKETRQATNAQEKLNRAQRRGAETTSLFSRRVRDSDKNIRQFFGSLNIAQQAAASFRASLMGLGAGFGIFTGSTIVAAAAVYGFAAAIRTSVVFGAQFERAFERMVHISKASGAQIELLSHKVRELGATTQFTAIEVAQAGTELAQAGLRPIDIYNTLEDTLTISAIGMMDLAESAMITVNTMAAFRLRSDEMTHAVDVMAHSIITSSITLKDFAQTMRYVGPAASTAGGSLEDAAAAIVLLGNVGIKGSKAGTSLRRAFVNLVKPTTEGMVALSKLGVAIKDSSGQMRNMVDIFEDLAKNGATSMDLIRIFGVRAFSAVSVLLENSTEAAAETGKSFREIRDEMLLLDNVAQRLRKNLEDNLEVKFLALKSAIQDVQIEAFEMFGGELQKKVVQFTETIRENSTRIAKALNDVIMAVVSGIEWLAENYRMILGVLAGWAAWKVGITVFSGLVGVVGSAAKAVQYFGEVSEVAARRWKRLAFFTGAIGLLAVAVGTVTAAMSAYSVGTEQATEATYDLGTAAQRTREEILKMSDAELGVHQIKLREEAESLADSIGIYEAEVAKLERQQRRLEALSGRTDVEILIDLQTANPNRTSFDIEGERARVRARLAEVSELLGDKQAYLAKANESLAQTNEKATFVENLRTRTLEGLRKVTSETSDATTQYSGNLTKTLEEMERQAQTLGLTEKAAFRYKVTQGELSEVIAQVSLQQSQQIGSTYNQIIATEKAIDAAKEQGNSTAELEAKLASLNSAYGALITKREEAQRATLEEYALQIRVGEAIVSSTQAYEELVGGVSMARRETAAYNEAISKIGTDAAFAADWAERLGVSIEFITTALTKMRDQHALETVAATLEKMFLGLDGLTAALQETPQAFATLDEYVAASTALLKAHGYQGEELEGMLEKLVKGYEKVWQAIEAPNQNLRNQIELFKQGEKALFVYNFLWEKLGVKWEEAPPRLVAIANAAYDLNQEMSRLEEVKNIWDNFFSTLSDSFEDVLKGSIRTFDDFAKSIEQGFKNLLAELIMTAAKNKIVMNITASGGQGFWGLFSSQGMLGSMMGGAAPTAGNSLLNAAMTGGSSAAAAMGGNTLSTVSTTGGIGAINASASAAAAPGATFTTGAAGAGGAAGLMGVPVVGWIAAAMMLNDSLFSAGWKPDSSMPTTAFSDFMVSQTNISDILGSFAGSTGRSITSVNSQEDAAAIEAFIRQQYADDPIRQQNALRRLSEHQAALASQQPRDYDPFAGMGALEFESVMAPVHIDKLLQDIGLNDRLASIITGSAITTALFGHKEPEITGESLNLGFRRGDVTGQSVAEILAEGGLFRSDDRWTETRDLAPGFLSDLGEAFSTLLDPFRAIAESLGADAGALDDFTGGRTSIDITDLSDEEIQAKIQEWLEGSVVDALEHFVRTADGLSDTFRKNVLLFTSDSKDFLAAFEAMTSIEISLDLSPMTEAERLYQDASMTATEALAKQNDKLRELAGEYTGTIPQMEELAAALEIQRDMATQLGLALMQLSDTVESVFQQTSISIQEALLEGEELYNFRKDRLEDLIAQVETTTDPGQIESLVGLIDGLVNTMFGSLDESQQAEMGPEFLQLLEDLNAQAQDQIQEGLDNLASESEALTLSVDTSLLDAAAKKHQEAAQALAEAALELRKAARLQQQRNGGSTSGGNSGPNFQRPNQIGNRIPS